MANITIIPPTVSEEPKTLRVAAYCRVSTDAKEQELSYASQVRSYTELITRHEGWEMVDVYADDGFSGTNFDRPDFKRMIADVEAGKINCVITKDLSRLGRNYLLTGQYIDLYFPEHGVRYIAIENNVDTCNQQSSEFTPFLNVFNEWYARDTSKKNKAAFHAKYLAGDHISGHAPLGYKKDPDNKCHLLIDTDTSWIIEKIYDLALAGNGPRKIQRALFEEKIPTPAWWNYQKYGTFSYVFEGKPESKRCDWLLCQIKKILVTIQSPARKGLKNAEYVVR